jgi:hypothetical protein
LVLVFCLWGSWARAQQASTSFSLAYSVPTGCPARAAFASAVIARSRGAHLQSEAPRVALDVSLTGDAELASGTLAIQLSDGQGSHREIPAAACEQVLSSMALIAAMILDGGGLDDPPPVASVSERATLASAPPPAVGVHPDSAPHDQAALREQPGRAQEGAKRPAVSAMLGLGLLAAGLRTGKYRVWAAVMIAAACVSHGIVLLFVVGAAVTFIGIIHPHWWGPGWFRRAPSGRSRMRGA